MNTNKYTLINAEQRHAANPNLFELPSRSSRQRVAPNDFVKLMFEQDGKVERMWVKVTKNPPKSPYQGTLVSDPVAINAIATGDMVTFTAKHIAAIMPADDAEKTLACITDKFEATSTDAQIEVEGREVRIARIAVSQVIEDGRNSQTANRKVPDPALQDLLHGYRVTITIDDHNNGYELITITDTLRRELSVAAHYKDGVIFTVYFLNNQYYDIPTDMLYDCLASILRGSYRCGTQGIFKKHPSTHVILADGARLEPTRVTVPDEGEIMQPYLPLPFSRWISWNGATTMKEQKTANQHPRTIQMCICGLRRTTIEKGVVYFGIGLLIVLAAALFIGFGMKGIASLLAGVLGLFCVITIVEQSNGHTWPCARRQAVLRIVDAAGFISPF